MTMPPNFQRPSGAGQMPGMEDLMSRIGQRASGAQPPQGGGFPAMPNISAQLQSLMSNQSIPPQAKQMLERLMPFFSGQMPIKDFLAQFGGQMPEMPGMPETPGMPSASDSSSWAWSQNNNGVATGGQGTGAPPADMPGMPGGGQWQGLSAFLNANRPQRPARPQGGEQMPEGAPDGNAIRQMMRQRMMRRRPM